MCRDWQKLVHRHEFIHWQVLDQLSSAAGDADEEMLPIAESTSCVLGDGFHGSRQSSIRSKNHISVHFEMRGTFGIERKWSMLLEF